MGEVEVGDREGKVDIRERGEMRGREIGLA